MPGKIVSKSWKIKNASNIVLCIASVPEQFSSLSYTGHYCVILCFVSYYSILHILTLLLF